MEFLKIFGLVWLWAFFYPLAVLGVVYSFINLLKFKSLSIPRHKQLTLIGVFVLTPIVIIFSIYTHVPQTVWEILNSTSSENSSSDYDEDNDGCDYYRDPC